MIRITEVVLPLDHTPQMLREAVARRLGVADGDLLEVSLFKRSYDARRRNAVILFVFVVDVAVRDEESVLRRFVGDRHVGTAPDTDYHPVAHAPSQLDAHLHFLPPWRRTVRAVADRTGPGRAELDCGRREAGGGRMTSGAISPRRSAYDDASRSAMDAAGNAADYLRRARVQRQREATVQVRDELRRRLPTRARSGFDRALLLCAAVALVCAALALIVSTLGVFG